MSKKNYMYSYSLNLIIEWIKTKNPIPEFKVSNSNLSGVLMTNTGILLKLNDDFSLSIQTDPNTAGWAFAETALMNKKGIFYDDKLGYEDVCRFKTPEKLYDHIDELIEKLKDYKPEESLEQDNSISESNKGESLSTNIRIPNINEIVNVTIGKFVEMGQYVTLDDYNNIEGMILLSEMSNRSLNKDFKGLKEGRKTKAIVLRTQINCSNSIDNVPIYIDLSIKKLNN